MAKSRTLGQIMEDKYLACRNAGIDITEIYERAAAAVEREVKRRLKVDRHYTRSAPKGNKGKP